MLWSCAKLGLTASTVFQLGQTPTFSLLLLLLLLMMLFLLLLNVQAIKVFFKKKLTIKPFTCLTQYDCQFRQQEVIFDILFSKYILSRVYSFLRLEMAYLSSVLNVINN